MSTQFDLGTARGEIRIDASSLDVAAAKSKALATTMASSFKTVGASLVKTGRTMTTSFTLPIVAGIAFAVKAFNEAAAANAQTAARIKSTGGAANVTMNQVKALSDTVRNFSGIEDEVVQAGANMLLTFTQIRNRVGEGNDIFNQAVEATADLSVGFGTDMPQAAIRLGKALNDPLRGLTNLARVGVLFDEKQKEQIRTFVANNDILGAQKVILAEVTEEFGNSARAMGRTPWGKTKIALSQLQDQFERLGAAVAPVILAIANGLKSIVDWISKLPAPAKLFLGVMTGILAVMGPLLIVFGAILKTVAFFVNAFAAAKVAIGAFAGATEVAISKMSSLSEKQIAASQSFGTFLRTVASGIGPIGIMAVAIGVGLTAAFIQQSRAIAKAKEQMRDWAKAAVSAALQGQRAFAKIDVQAIKEISEIVGDATIGLEFFTTANQQLATAFRSGTINVTNASKAYDDLIGKAKEAGGIYDIWAQIVDRSGEGTDFATDRLSKLSQTMFEAGTITKEQLVQNLVLLGFTMEESRTIATGLAHDIGLVGQQTDVTGKKIESFAGMTVEAFEEWRTGVVDNLLSATPALDRLADRAKITSQAIVVSFRRQERQFTNYAKNFAKFTDLDLPDELKQQVIDLGIEGGPAMQAFNRLTDKELKGVSQSFRKGQQAIKSTNDPLKGLVGDADAASGAVQGLSDKLAILARYKQLDLNITTHFHTTGTPPGDLVKGQVASGGTLSSGGMYLVGERGPELALLPKGASILESSKTLNLLRQMSADVRLPLPVSEGGGSQTFIFELDGEAIYKTVRNRDRETRIRLGSRD